ncbi:hypothetical protein [uncultured Nostoc sp.]
MPKSIVNASERSHLFLRGEVIQNLLEFCCGRNSDRTHYTICTD